MHFNKSLSPILFNNQVIVQKAIEVLSYFYSNPSIFRGGGGGGRCGGGGGGGRCGGGGGMGWVGT